MEKTKIVTVKYPAGHSYEFTMKFDDELFCPNCGNKGIWFEDGTGDYYEGVSHYCTSCSFDFTMPSFGKADEQIINQLKD